MSGLINNGVLQSGALTNILRGIIPTAPSWDGQIGKAFQAKTGGTVFTDLTTGANEATANDVTFFDATMQLNDAFYFGDAANAFNHLKINVGTAGVYNATLVWEYWNGAAWATLTTVDGTNLLTTAGSNYVTFTAPADWAKTTVNAINAYWVRLRVSAYTGKTTAPLGTQIWMGVTPTSLDNITDGDITTVTGTGTVVMGAAGDYGYIVFDMGAPKTYLVSARVGLWTSAGTVQAILQSSDDNLAYRGAGAISSSTGASEDIREGAAMVLMGRYFRLRLNASVAATVNAKIYKVVAYELSL